MKEENLSDKMPSKSYIFTIDGQQEFFIALEDYAKFVEDVRDAVSKISNEHWINAKRSRR